jgi:lipopolysaccharide transport system ATP-binding protein
MSTVISVEHLSKTYRLGQIGTGTFTNDLKLWWAKIRGKPNPLLRIGETDHGNRDSEELWALRDVSFTVEQGEVLGIIGHNGAGKSTLLKILSRVTAPTSGKIKVKGRIASLLEVGTGFHPDLTGRENIYLNGAILGMKQDEIKRKFDEIVDFSGVEQFIDTPVKRYSSGMYIRLAFAVAAHLEPEILVVDEVLAVGDAEFQRKCLGKMGEVAKDGRTVLFVSHNMAAVESLCQNGLLMSKGTVLLYDEISVVKTAYMRSLVETNYKTSFQNKKNSILSLRKLRTLLGDSEETSIFQTGDHFTIDAQFSLEAAQRFFIGASIWNEWQQLIFAFHSRESGLIIDRDIGGDFSFKVTIPHLLLLPGRFYIRLIVVDLNRKILGEYNNAAFIDILPKDIANSGLPFLQQHGIMFMPFKMQLISNKQVWTKEVLAS